MKIEIETAPNGYVIRGDEGEILELIANDDEVEAAREMLWSVNEHVGLPGSRHDEHRIRIITPPGDHWMPAKRDTCKHPLVELVDYGDGPPWRCQCGARFELVTPGSSWEDELEREAQRRAGAQRCQAKATQSCRGRKLSCGVQRSREVRVSPADCRVPPADCLDSCSPGCATGRPDQCLWQAPDLVKGDRAIGYELFGRTSRWEAGRRLLPRAAVFTLPILE